MDKNLIQEYEAEHEETNERASQPPKCSPKTPLKHKSLQVKTSSSTSKPSPKASATKRIKTEVAPSSNSPPASPATAAAAAKSAENEDETDQLSVTQPSTVDDSGDEEVRILGAKPDNGVIMFLIEFPESKKLQFIESTVANKKYPQQVIKFYEARLDWLAEDVGGN